MIGRAMFHWTNWRARNYKTSVKWGPDFGHWLMGDGWPESFHLFRGWKR